MDEPGPPEMGVTCPVSLYTCNSHGRSISMYEINSTPANKNFRHHIFFAIMINTARINTTGRNNAIGLIRDAIPRSSPARNTYAKLRCFIETIKARIAPYKKNINGISVCGFFRNQRPIGYVIHAREAKSAIFFPQI